MLVVNAKPKIRPKPIKKTQLQPGPPIHQTSQATIPVPTSPFLAPQDPPNNSPHFDLPPSDPPLTSSLVPDRDIQLPPIEFLRPPLSDSDAPLSSSLPGENTDELQVSNHKNQASRDPGPVLLPPPPTFFAGSSSSPVVNPPTVHTHQQHLPPADIVDLTDIPTTAAPLTAITDASDTAKAKKPRKPRKRKGEAGDAPALDEQAQPTTSKKRKSKANTVTVEVLLPLPTNNTDGPDTIAPKRKGKQRRTYDEVNEDELNIGAGLDDNATGRAAGPSSFSTGDIDNPVYEDTNSIGGNEIASARPQRPNKRKGRKRKDQTEPDDSVPVTASPNKKKKTLGKTQDDGPDEAPPATKKALKKKGKDDGERGNTDTNEIIPATRITKGKGRMVIASDDEDGAQPVVAGDLPPETQEAHKGKRKPMSEAEEGSPQDDTNTNENRSQDDRDVHKVSHHSSHMFRILTFPNLYHKQLADVRNSLTDRNKSVNPPQRHETPSIAKYPSLSSKYTIAPKTQTSSMSELIRRVNSLPNSPLPNAAGRGSPIPGLAYSPYLKASRRALSRIAPLHPNRRTPPPPLPPPPPKKKSKKELEMEEKWEEEIIEEIGGITEWLALSESEKKDLKRLKRDREMGYCED